MEKMLIMGRNEKGHAERHVLFLFTDDAADHEAVEAEPNENGEAVEAAHGGSEAVEAEEEQ